MNTLSTTGELEMGRIDWLAWLLRGVAIAALLVATGALGTGAYLWWSANPRPTAAQVAVEAFRMR